MCLIHLSFRPTTIICCLASRSGVKRDAFAVDYQGGSNLVESLKLLKINSTNHEIRPHFVLLSAFCCGKPRLQFQLAKLKLEDEIRNSIQSISHSIVRPTAFFKSLDGQIESARKNLPILYFGDGSCAANPISDIDLAEYLVNCAIQPKLPEIDMFDQTRDIGGCDIPPITKLQQIELIYQALGKNNPKDRKTIAIPLKIFDILIGIFNFLESIATVFHATNTIEKCNDAAELARIVHYYASEPMVATGPKQVIGKIKLKDHFNYIASKNGILDEINPMTTTTGVLNVFVNNEYVK